MSIRVPSMPYFEIALDELDADNQLVEKAWSRNIHFGFWTDPAAPDLTLDGYVRAMEDMTRQHFKHARIEAGQKIVDVGCGLGGTVALLNESFNGLDLVGVNVDERQLARARRSVLSRPESENQITFMLGDACNLPLDDHSVDVVFAVECIFHFGSRLRFFEEARRVLKPGGRLAVSEFVARSWTLPLLAGLYLPFHSAIKGTYGDSAPPATRSSYRKIAARAGLEVVSFDDVTEHTLPNYAVVPTLLADVGRSAPFRRGFKFLEYATRLGFYRYDVLSFRACP